MLKRWKFIKDRYGAWRWYYTEADGSVTKALSSFSSHGVCMADAKKNGWRWLPEQRKLYVLSSAKN